MVKKDKEIIEDKINYLSDIEIYFKKSKILDAYNLELSYILNKKRINKTVIRDIKNIIEKVHTMVWEEVKKIENRLLEERKFLEEMIEK